MSLCYWSRLIEVLLKIPEAQNNVPSTNREIFARTKSGISLMCIENSNGQKQEPCGTPACSSFGVGVFFACYPFKRSPVNEGSDYNQKLLWQSILDQFIDQTVVLDFVECVLHVQKNRRGFRSLIEVVGYFIPSYCLGSFLLFLRWWRRRSDPFTFLRCVIYLLTGTVGVLKWEGVRPQKCGFKSKGVPTSTGVSIERDICNLINSVRLFRHGKEKKKMQHIRRRKIEEEKNGGWVLRQCGGVTSRHLG